MPASEPRFREDADRKRPAAARVVDVLEIRIRKERFGARFARYRSPSSTPNEIVSDRS